MPRAHKARCVHVTVPQHAPDHTLLMIRQRYSPIGPHTQVPSNYLGHIFTLPLVTWGLVSVKGTAIDLHSVSVEANVVDFAAEVSVVQVYSSRAEACEAVRWRSE